MILPTSTGVVAPLAVLVCWLLVDTFADGGQPISAGFSRNHDTATRAGAGEVGTLGFDSQTRGTAGPAEGFPVSGEMLKRHSLTDWDLYAENTKHADAWTWTECVDNKLSMQSEAHVNAQPGEKPGIDFQTLLGLGLVALAMRIGFPDRSRRSHLHLLMRAPQPPAQWSSRTPADPHG